MRRTKRGTSRGSHMSTSNLNHLPNIPVMPGFTETKWREMQAEHEKRVMICELREEIIKKALDEVYEKILEKQQIKYVVECAHSALLRILDLQFYVHDSPEQFYKVDSSWTPDPDSDPCPPDSWARGNIQVVPKPKQIEKEEKEEVVSEISDFVAVESIPDEYFFKGTKETEKNIDYNKSSLREESLGKILNEVFKEATKTKENLTSEEDSVQELFVKMSPINVQPCNSLTEQEEFAE